ncbi:SIMPL domain-containing protein [Thermithiobacillus plumbiphilus]|uniref:SIMPL domain-containing protein n=1 Tax=Thermithiobacillus plumbiphilus TaxID=1729899 RepID=A0ABU9D815_9PROT
MRSFYRSGIPVGLAGLLCLSMLMPGLAQAMPIQVEQPQILVSGTGRASVAPDEATLTIAVETHATTAAAAASSNARQMQTVREALQRAGLPAAALSTQDYTVQARIRYEREQSRMDGYDAANTLKVKTRELARLGAYMDAALAAGATRIGGVEFTASQLDNVRRVALAQAIVQARGDAQAMADAAGGRLGELLELSTNPASPGPVPFRAAMAEQAKVETPISPGEVTVETVVSTRWRFMPR